MHESTPQTVGAVGNPDSTALSVLVILVNQKRSKDVHVLAVLYDENGMAFAGNRAESGRANRDGVRSAVGKKRKKRRTMCDAFLVGIPGIEPGTPSV